jgi:hypothetical protein
VLKKSASGRRTLFGLSRLSGLFSLCGFSGSSNKTNQMNQTNPSRPSLLSPTLTIAAEVLVNNAG